jgi:predicted dehydrogenase
MAQLQFGKIPLFWVGSGHMVDNLIHQIDECCWLMDDWPVSCHGMGGREVGSTDRGQNIDTYSMEFTFKDGRKGVLRLPPRSGRAYEFATFVHGSKKAGQFSGNIHAATVHIFKDQRIANDNIEWSPTPDAHSPWDYQWIDFIDAIRNDKPFNQAKRAVYADYASLMGRAAVTTTASSPGTKSSTRSSSSATYLDELELRQPRAGPGRRGRLLSSYNPCQRVAMSPRMSELGKSSSQLAPSGLYLVRMPCCSR